MTRNEYIKIVTERREEIEKLKKQMLEIYYEHIQPIELLRLDIRNYMYECEMKNDWVDYKFSKRKDEEYTQQILDLEEELGSNDLDKIKDNIYDEILITIENAKDELNQFEFYTSSELCNSYESMLYYRKYKFSIDTFFSSHASFSSLYCMNTGFDFSNGHLFLEGILPYLKFNSIWNGCDVIKFTYSDRPDEFPIYTHIVFHDEMWIVLIEDDIVFEHESCKEVLEYFNLIR